VLADQVECRPTWQAMKCIVSYQERTATEPAVAIISYGHRQQNLDIGSSLVKLGGRLQTPDAARKGYRL